MTPYARQFLWQIGRWRPAAVLFGPIFAKDMAVSGRRNLTYVVRAGYAVFMTLVLAIALAAVREEGWSGRAARFQEAATIAPRLAVIIGWVQFIGLTLFAAVLCSGAICEEKLARTLPTLATTPMTGAQIIFSKLSSRMAQISVLLLVSVPALLLLRLFGGLDARIVLGITACSLSSALLSGSIALMYSVWHRRAWTAVIMTVLTLALLYAGPLMGVGIYMFSLGINSPPSPQLLVVLAMCLPPVAMALLTARASGAPLPEIADLAWIPSSTAALLAALAFCLFASFALRRVLLAESRGWVAGRGGLTPWLGARTYRGRAAARRARATERRAAHATRRRSRRLSDRPILWRELRTPILGSTRRSLIVLLVIAAGMAWLYSIVDPEETDFQFVIGVAWTGLLLVAAAGLTTPAIGAEREGRTLEVLLTTPIRPRRIVLQKLAAALLRLSIIPIYLTGHFAVYAWRGVISPFTAVHILLLTTGYTTLLAGGGIFWSTLCRRTLGAMVCNFGAAIVVWIGAPMLTVVICEAVLSGVNANAPLTVLATINPGYLTVTSIQGGLDMMQVYRDMPVGGGVGSVAPGPYHLGEIELGPMGFTVAIALSSAAAATIGLAACLAAGARLRSRSEAIRH